MILVALPGEVLYRCRQVMNKRPLHRLLLFLGVVRVVIGGIVFWLTLRFQDDGRRAHHVKAAC